MGPSLAFIKYMSGAKSLDTRSAREYLTFMVLTRYLIKIKRTILVMYLVQNSILVYPKLQLRAF